MNAQFSVGPAASPSGASQKTQFQPETTAATRDPDVPEGVFQGLLDQRMAPAATEAVPAEVPADTASDPSSVLQGLDAKALPVDALAAFLAGQTLMSQRSASAAGAAPAGDIRLGLARELAVEWRTFAEAGNGRDGTMADDGTGAADRMMAAMSAEAGKRLPQMMPDPASAIRTLVNEATMAGTGTADPASLLAGGDTPVLPAGGVAAPATAQAAPGSTEVRASSASVPTPFGRPEWADAMGERVTWLVGQRIQSADIRLNPPQLGPVEVRISIQNDQASLFFSSSHAMVRDAIQAALPRLTEMLAQSGLTLGQTSVGAESFAGQQQAFRDSGGDGRGTAHPGSGGRGSDPVVADTRANQVQAGLYGRAGIDMFV